MCDYYQEDESRPTATSSPLCVGCEDVGASVFEFGGMWHRSCLAEFVTGYVDFLQSIECLTSYQPAPKPRSEWSQI